MTTAPRSHWDDVWAARDPATVSWYQTEPTLSLALIATTAAGPNDAIVDVGCGASPLAAALLRAGHRDITVLDIAGESLTILEASLRAEHGDDVGNRVNFVCSDVLAWQAHRPYRLWHDRAVNHFLTGPEDRRRYRDIATETIETGGCLILAAFALDGPDQCSGLPVHRVESGELAAEYAPDFELVDVVRAIHITPWQSPQSFQYLLLQHR